MVYAKAMIVVLISIILAFGLSQLVQGAATDEEKQLREDFVADLKHSEDIGMKKESMIRGYIDLGQRMKRVAELIRNAKAEQDRVRGENSTKASRLYDTIILLKNESDLLQYHQMLSVKEYAVLSKIEDLETSLQKGKVSRTEYSQEKQALLTEVRYLQQQGQEKELTY